MPSLLKKQTKTLLLFPTLCLYCLFILSSQNTIFLSFLSHNPFSVPAQCQNPSHHFYDLHLSIHEIAFDDYHRCFKMHFIRTGTYLKDDIF